MYLVFVLYMLFAGVFTTAKTALEYSSPVFLVGTRMFAAGLLMLLYQLIFHRDRFEFKKESFWRVIRLAAFNIYLTNVFEFWGLKYLTSFKTCFIYSLSPFLSAIFSYMILSEKMTKKKWLGLAIGFAGFLPILLSQSGAEGETGTLLFFSWAEISVISAAVCSVYGWILLRQLVSEDKYSPMMANGLSMTIGGAIALAHSFLTEPWNPIPVTEFAPFLECTLLLMLLSNLCAYNLYGHLLKTYTATFVSFAGFTTPLFTALFGWYFLGEEVTTPFYISAIIVYTGLFFFHQEELKEGYLIKKGKKNLKPPPLAKLSEGS